MVPLRAVPPKPGTGRRQEANRITTGVDVKVVYDLNGPQNQYRQDLPDYTIEAKLSGTIAIENLGIDRYEHNLELSLKKDGPEAKPELGKFSDHAFRDLTQDVSLKYSGGRVTIEAPITYKAGLGPLTIAVQAESPTTFKGSIKPNPISASTTLGRRKYKYVANIKFEVTVTLHPMSRQTPQASRQTAP